ncbi:unnamed protein product [Schistocephalus solidus]|uniref:EKC/KEOPS complex subunit GON7 n=1 Tax=Schistocephalus solidus TaxID=70667 RepID=A0A183SUX3_SCHSO|nr:unnamed protein product [Schistocephalus solidus]
MSKEEVVITRAYVIYAFFVPRVSPTLSHVSVRGAHVVPNPDPNLNILCCISQLSSNFDKLGASLKRQLDDMSERISRLEALSHTSPTPANCDLSKATSGEEDRGKTASGDP